MPVSHGKIAPQESTGGDFLTDGDRETFALRRFIHYHRLRKSPIIVWSWEISPHDGDFLNGAIFSRGDYISSLVKISLLCGHVRHTVGKSDTVTVGLLNKEEEFVIKNNSNSGQNVWLCRPIRNTLAVINIFDLS